MNDKDILNNFGQLVVNRVRDDVILSIDKAILGDRKDIFSKHLQSMAEGFTSEQLVFTYELIPHLVDNTIAMFLQLFDVDQALQVNIQNSEGQYVDLSTLTDSIEAEYSHSEGWVNMFSEQRPDSIRKEARRIAEKNFEPPKWDD
jgi:hypothetical protein